MSMISMTGKVIHVFESPKGERKDGTAYGGQDKVQILGENLLPNGETRFGLIDLTAHDSKAFREFQGKDVSFPVGVMAAAKNQLVYFIPKGAQPVLSSPPAKFGADVSKKVIL
jgi:hypothetical protein